MSDFCHTIIVPGGLKAHPECRCPCPDAPTYKCDIDVPRDPKDPNPFQNGCGHTSFEGPVRRRRKAD
jgi:hypothetical protein